MSNIYIFKYFNHILLSAIYNKIIFSPNMILIIYFLSFKKNKLVANLTFNEPREDRSECYKDIVMD